MSQPIKTFFEQSAPLVLVVDDSEDIRELVKIVLDTCGYRVSEAVNGQEALKIAGREHPDLILMDLSMPVLDGFDAARALRQVEETRAVPLVAVSAHTSSTHRARALAVGFNDYLTKPIDFIKMVKLIHSLLHAAQPL
ncbi:MAG TPA: response regulator [Pyrinomonadaceae bacterium]